MVTSSKHWRSADRRLGQQSSEELLGKSIAFLRASTQNPLPPEERAHQTRIKEARMTDHEQGVFESKTQAALPELEALLHDVAQDQAKPFLDHAIEHELATAAFYSTLARTAKLPGLKRTLRALADEEKRHAQMLKELQTHLSV